MTVNDQSSPGAGDQADYDFGWYQPKARKTQAQARRKGTTARCQVSLKAVISEKWALPGSVEAVTSSYLIVGNGAHLVDGWDSRVEGGAVRAAVLPEGGGREAAGSREDDCAARSKGCQQTCGSRKPERKKSQT
eukprot:scaffold15714_cov20-Tisochrysis_lutea.AAC.3